MMHRKTCAQFHTDETRFLFSRPGDNMEQWIVATAFRTPKGAEISLSCKDLQQVARNTLSFTARGVALSEPRRWQDNPENAETFMISGDEMLAFLEECEGVVAKSVGNLATHRPLVRASRHGDRFANAKLIKDPVWWEQGQQVPERPQDFHGRPMCIMGELRPWVMHGEWGLSLRVLQVQFE